MSYTMYNLQISCLQLGRKGISMKVGNNTLAYNTSNVQDSDEENSKTTDIQEEKIIEIQSDEDNSVHVEDTQ